MFEVAERVTEREGERRFPSSVQLGVLFSFYSQSSLSRQTLLQENSGGQASPRKRRTNSKSSDTVAL